MLIIQAPNPFIPISLKNFSTFQKRAELRDFAALANIKVCFQQSYSIIS